MNSGFSPKLLSWKSQYKLLGDPGVTHVVELNCYRCIWVEVLNLTLGFVDQTNLWANCLAFYVVGLKDDNQLM
jgi:hypothetical protein